jgi:hypothetical protein
VQSTDGGYVIAGYTDSYGVGGYDVFLIKTDTSGDTLWTRTFGGSNGDFGYSVQQTSDGGYVITGLTESYGAGSSDVYMIKTTAGGSPVMPLDQPVQPLSFALGKPYPNPFNPSTAIRYELRAASHVSLKVYDTSGRVVATLVDGWRQAGEHRATFDGSGLAAGVYLVRLEAGGATATQKVVLLK